jgi:hypothetical protein
MRAVRALDTSIVMAVGRKRGSIDIGTRISRCTVTSNLGVFLVKTLETVRLEILGFQKLHHILRLLNATRKAIKSNVDIKSCLMCPSRKKLRRLYRKGQMLLSTTQFFLLVQLGHLLQ